MSRCGGRNLNRSEGRAGVSYPVDGSSARAVMVVPEATIIVNADDWGAHVLTTNRILDCILHGSVSSTSAMVFMEDSKRAAELARRHHVDTGLHLNLTTAFTAPACTARLKEHQGRIRSFLRLHQYAPAFYHPGLAASFEYVVKAQLEEYERLYGAQPARIDGHHHMHLCANVVLGKLLPAGTIVRRNFTFRPGEKGIVNRALRGWCDGRLARRHRLADYFFNLVPIDSPERLEMIFALGAGSNVEIETHPASEDEYRFLMGPEFERYASKVSVASSYTLRGFEKTRGGSVA